jgi:DNA mismatch endonuclease (patch repair protein)
MADIFSKAERSAIMKKVKGAGNKTTEQALIRLFKEHHITGWQRNFKLVGKPDFVFRRPKIAIFADGCFWHGHNCRNITPQQNKLYWDKKRERNIQRDITINKTLLSKGWRILRFWECDIKNGVIDLTILMNINSNCASLDIQKV